MRLATWNLWWRFGPWRERAPRIAQELFAVGADVIGLQEVWHTAERNQAAELAADLDWHVAFGPSSAPEKWQERIDDSAVGIGNAVLSRWPIEHVSITRLPAGDARDEGRLALHCVIVTPYGRLPFTTLHLNSSEAHSAIRTLQVQAALEGMMAIPEGDLPPVLCGDFNAMDDSAEVSLVTTRATPSGRALDLHDAWWAARSDEPMPTWDVGNAHVPQAHGPTCRIDYLFVGRQGSGDHDERTGSVSSAGLFADQPRDRLWASDHYGVWIEFDAPERSKHPTTS